MSVRNLGVIAGRLIAGGMRADMPAAAISRAASPEQTLLVGTLATLPDLLDRHPLPTPALIVIGGIVAMRDALGGLAADAMAVLETF